MKSEWMKTEQMLEALRGEPDTEQQYCHYLGGMLRSTHWLIFSTERNKLGDSTDWDDYEWYADAEFLEMYAGHWWMREA